MIARISGTLLQKSAGSVVVDSQGIGYQVFIPLTTLYDLPPLGQRVTLHIHTQVKEDAIHLFGFLTPREKDLFQVMISVSGIGPRLALNILSGATAEELAAGISQGNLSRLTAIPGVGKKTAERMVLELRDKMANLGVPEVSAAGDEAAAQRSLREDAASALVNLGYRSQAVHAALDRIMADAGEDLGIDLLLKRTLQVLAGRPAGRGQKTAPPGGAS